MPAQITLYDQFNLKGSGNAGWGYAGYKAYTPANPEDWALAAFDLSIYNGRSVQMRLVFRSSTSLTNAGTYVDDIRVDDEASDPDNDGLLGVLSEWNNTATDPFINDSDGDGALDGADTFPLNAAAGYAGAVMMTAPMLLDFEADNNGVATAGRLWQYGTPTTGPNTAFSGSKVWATNLTGAYTNNAVEYLYIPSANLAAASRTTLSMRLWANAWGSGDGTTVEVYDVSLARWLPLHARITPYEATINSGGNLLPAWANQNNAQGNYTLAAFDLSRYAGNQVQLRLVFRSSATLTANGMYIDDIRLDDETVDADNDGLMGVLDEYFNYQTDPFVADTDGGNGLNLCFYMNIPAKFHLVY